MPNETEATIDQEIAILKLKLAAVDKMLALFAEFEEREELSKPLWLKVWEIDTARRLANILLEPPLMDEEIDWYARRFDLTKLEAQAELRRSHNDS